MPIRISFKGAMQQMDAFAHRVAIGDQQARLVDELLRAIAYYRIGIDLDV
ncbi:MAG: hypothetical protein HQL98_00865 [Magnetococcales bacterium]|nr:hypothetical protein [Magnetococcales bacterium]